MRNRSSMIERRLKPIVFLKPRKKQLGDASKRTPEHALTALRVNPSDRTPQDIDAIMAILGKWNDFTKFVHTEQERREVCRRITCEDYKGNQILFKQGDDPDGWYLVWSGQCSIHIKLPVHDESNHSQIPASTVAALRAAFGPDDCFLQVAVKRATEEFGSTALTKNDVRNATIFVDEPSIILRVDPHLYRDTAAWFARSQLEKKAVLLSHIPELQFLRESRELFVRLAENMEQLKLDAGVVIDEKFFGKDENSISFIVVEEGLLVKQRLVDFTGHRVDQSASSIQVQIPRGKHTVRVANFGPKTMFPDPALKKYVPYPFTLYVAEPVIAWQLKVKDLASMLLTVQMQKITDAYRDEPNDDQVVNIWIEKQRAIQWQAFKRKCVKEARQMVKVEKLVQNGQWGQRNPAPPKAIKEHKPFPALSRRVYSCS